MEKKARFYGGYVLRIAVGITAFVLLIPSGSTTTNNTLVLTLI